MAAEITGDQAVKALTDHCLAQEIYAADWKPIEFRLLGYSNKGYTIEVYVASRSFEGVLIDTWRVDSMSGPLYLRDAKGKFKQRVRTTLRMQPAPAT